VLRGFQASLRDADLDLLDADPALETPGYLQSPLWGFRWPQKNPHFSHKECARNGALVLPTKPRTPTLSPQKAAEARVGHPPSLLLSSCPLFRRLGDFQDLIGVDILERLHDSGGPVDFYRVGFRVLAKPEMNGTVA